MVSSVFYSSQSDDWETPQDVFDKMNALFRFRLDACAAKHNHKCAKYFSQQENALEQNWHKHKRVWMNPPYGRSIGKWMEKAYTESLKGCVVVCLVFSKTDTRWWHDWVKGKAHVTYVKGRLQFTNPKQNAESRQNKSPFPSAIVIYGLDIERMING